MSVSVNVNRKQSPDLEAAAEGSRITTQTCSDSERRHGLGNLQVPAGSVYTNPLIGSPSYQSSPAKLPFNRCASIYSVDGIVENYAGGLRAACHWQCQSGWFAVQNQLQFQFNHALKCSECSFVLILVIH